MLYHSGRLTPQIIDVFLFMAEFCNKCSIQFGLKKEGATALCEHCGNFSKERRNLGVFIVSLLILWQIVILFIK